MPCSGDASESCGGTDRINIFWSGAAAPIVPVENPGVGLWTSLGCYTCVFASVYLLHLTDAFCISSPLNYLQ